MPRHHRRSPLRASASALALVALAGGLLAATPTAADAAPTAVARTASAPVGAGEGPATASIVRAATTTVARPAGVPGFDIYEPTLHAQTAADFSSAYGKGARFVYIKASGGVKVTNDNLTSQFANARAAGLLVGTYHLAAPNLASPTKGRTSAQAQAAWFTANGGRWSKGGWILPPMLDLEKNTAAQQPGVGACYDMTPTALVAWVGQFSAAVGSATGRAPIIYTSASFWADCMGKTASLPANQLFLASYPTNTASGPGTIPASWASFSFWQYSDQETPLPGDQDVFNGTLTSLHLLADPTWGSGTKASTRAHDYSGDGKADVLTRYGDTLRMYRGNGKGGFVNYANVLSNVKSLKTLVAPGDMNGDGVPDLLDLRTNGASYFYAGKRGGGFSAPKAAATGLGAMNLLTGVGDFNGDGKADLLTRDSKGILWLYEGNGAGQFAGRVQIGSGQSSVRQIVGVDNFGPGRSKGIVTNDSKGSVRFYPRTSTGFGAATVIGSGWTVYDSLSSPGDLTGDGVSDLLVRRSSGEMSMYAGTGAGKLKPRAVVATGWTPFTYIG